MKPIPVAFHIGPLEVHTYGIGLAVTFWFAYRYFERRLRDRGYPTDWLVGLFLWVIVAAVVGARTLHVVSNLGYYAHDPAEVLAIWHGGLSSFGGLLFAVPTAVWITRRRCPTLPLPRALDLVAPVLAAAWAMGRLLGPQLMVAGGGHRTAQWFGMYYATQAGKRLPVPIFQAMEDVVVFVVLVLLERRLDRWPDGTRRVGYPSGAVIGTGMVLWGVERTLDQRLWLAYPGNLGSVLVQLAGVGLAVSGVVVLVLVRRHWRAWTDAGAPVPDGSPEAAAAAARDATATDAGVPRATADAAAGPDPGGPAPGGDPSPGAPVPGDPVPGDPVRGA